MFPSPLQKSDRTVGEFLGQDALNLLFLGDTNRVVAVTDLALHEAEVSGKQDLYFGWVVQNQAQICMPCGGVMWCPTTDYTIRSGIPPIEQPSLMFVAIVIERPIDLPNRDASLGIAACARVLRKLQ